MRFPKLGYPTREGLYYLFMMMFVFTGAIIREINTMLIVGGFMSGPMIYSIFASRRMLRRVKMKRVLPEGVHAGTVGVVECNFTCAQSLRCVTLHEELKADSPFAETERISVPLGQLALPGTLTQTYQVLPEQRGYHDFTGYQLTTSAPLGLWNHAIHRREKNQRWLIWPRLGKFIGASIPGFTEIPLRMTRRGQSQAALQGDFVGLRGWQRGDRRRDIHWRSTAKRGELLVKHYDQRNEMSWALVLDLWLPARPSDFDLHQIELAIQIGATLVQHFQVNYHGELTIVTIGDEYRVQHGITQRGFMAQVFDQMANAKGGPQFDAAKVKRSLDQHSPHRALVISTRPNGDSPNPGNSSTSLAHFLQSSELWPHCTINGRSTRDPHWLQLFAGLSEYGPTKLTNRGSR